MHGLICLQAIYPERNIKRFYNIRIDRNLFGTNYLLMTNGRMGQGGQTREKLFTNDDLLLKHLQSVLKKRFRAKRRIGVNYELKAKQLSTKLDATVNNWLQTSLGAQKLL